MWTKSPEQAPDHAAYVELSFDKGELSKINGHAVAPVAAIELLNEIGSEYGIGRIDIVENRLVGMKSRGCYETPGGTILMAALKGLEALVYDRTSLKYREEVGQEFAQLVYDGRWFTPLKDALLAAATSLAEQLTGDVVMKLYKGNVTVAKRRSPNSLYSEAFATFEGDEVYNQKDAAGFIRLYSLASRIRALHQQQKG
jgi:argininosuccinate synthase